MAGTLYLCATPIGNLEDITFRVLRTLKEVDLIAAEDTRHSIKLMNHFDIKTPMTSYHEYNKVEKARELVKKLKEGINIALITDAGTPGISDPGEELVRQCFEEDIPVTSLPGPAACITALTMSGQPVRRFCFEAFLPNGKADKKERQRILEELRGETRTMVIYEAPHHLLQTLKDLEEVLGERSISICRELTKKHEAVRRTTLREAVSFYEREEPRGEFVLVIEGKSLQEILLYESGNGKKGGHEGSGEGSGNQQAGGISAAAWTGKSAGAGFPIGRQRQKDRKRAAGSIPCGPFCQPVTFRPASLASSRMDALDTFFPWYSSRSSVLPVKMSADSAFLRMMQSSCTVISSPSLTSRFKLLRSSIGSVILPSSSSLRTTPVVFICNPP